MLTYNFEDLSLSAQERAGTYYDDAMNEVLDERADELQTDALNVLRSWRYDVTGERIA